MGMEHGENLPDVVAAFHRVAQRLVCADTIEVAATFALPIEIAGVDEVADDALRGAFGDADALGDISESQPGVARDTEQGVRMVGQKRPLRHSGNVPEVCHVSPCHTHTPGGYTINKSRLITRDT